MSQESKILRQEL